MKIFDKGDTGVHQDINILEENLLYCGSAEFFNYFNDFDDGACFDEQEYSEDYRLADSHEKFRKYICTHKDVINSVSMYMEIWSRHVKNKHLHTLYENKSVEDMLMDYHKRSTPEHIRKWLKNEVFFSIFFLLPHVIKKHYYLSVNSFEDAMQNMSYNVLMAIESFDPRLGTTFVNYLAGYFKAAVSKTFRDTNLIVIPAARRKILKDAVAREQDAEKEPEVSYPKIFMYDDTSNTCTGAFRGLAGSPWEQQEFDETVHNRQLVEWLEEALSRDAGVLTHDERRVLIMHYGLFGESPCTYQEIAKLHKAEGKGHACSRLSQISTQAKKKLRKFFAEMELERY